MSGTPKAWAEILLYAALFFIVTRIAAMLLQKSGAALYEWGWGLDAAGMLGARTPESMVSEMGWRAVPHVLLLAPFVEECAFRLGLSFRRWHIAAGLGVLAYFFADWMLFFADVANARYWALPVWIAVAAAVYGFTTDGFWLSKRDRWLRPAMWASTVVFALCTPAFRFGAYLGACCPMRYCMCWGSFSPGASLSICA